MDSPSRSRKRGSEDQPNKQIENSEPKNTKRWKASLGCILEPVPVDDPNFTRKLSPFAVSSDDHALYVSNNDMDLREQQHQKRSMVNAQSRREGEELSGTIAYDSILNQDSRNTGQGPITNYDNILGVPILTRHEDEGIALAGRNHTLQDYQMQLMLLEQQNRKHFEARKQQDAALRTITSLPDQLNIAHTSVKELLENLPAYFQNIEDFKDSILGHTKALQDNEEALNKKEAEIKALEDKYNELIQMTPEAQQGELRQIRDRAMLSMQKHWEKLRLDRDNTMEMVEGKNERIAGLEKALGRARELVPELIEDLIKLAPKLRDV
jgi:ElaB/YqjD/DUF883 family membrane-anchored ribosome-binding protein